MRGSEAERNNNEYPDVEDRDTIIYISRTNQLGHESKSKALEQKVELRLTRRIT